MCLIYPRLASKAELLLLIAKSKVKDSDKQNLLRPKLSIGTLSLDDPRNICAASPS